MTRRALLRGSVGLLLLGGALGGALAFLQPAAPGPPPALGPGAPAQAGHMARGGAGLAEPATATGAPVAAVVHDVEQRMAAGPGDRAWEATVVDARDSTAVAGATVSLARDLLSAEGTTGADGRVALWFPAGPGATLTVRHVDYVDFMRAEPDLSRVALLQLSPAGSLAGYLQGPGAHSPAGLMVGIWRDFGERYEGTPLAETAPGEDGAFRFASLAPGPYALGAFGGGAPLAFRDGLEVRAGEETFATLDVGAGMSLRGRVVVGESERPLQGAHVTVLPEVQGINDSVERLSSRQALTGADGRFEMSGLAQGGLDVEVLTPWGATSDEREDLSVYTYRTERVFRIPEPARLSGIVRHADGAPAAGALVAVATRDSRQRLDFERASATLDGGGSAPPLAARADPAGRFSFDAVPGWERLHLCAWPAGYGAAPPGAGLPGGRQLPEIPGGTERADVEIVLLEGSPLDGVVLDPDGNGIAGADVRLEIYFGGARHHESIPSQAGGAFTLPGVPREASLVRASLEGYRSTRRDVEEVGPDDLLVLTLHPLHVVRGRVEDQEGRAVADAEVRLSRKRRESHADNTDEFGRFAVYVSNAGSFRLSLSSPGHELAPGSPPSVRVPRDGELLLSVVASAPDAPVTLTGEVIDAETGEPVPHLRLRGNRGGITIIDGTHFTLEGMAPGTARLRASSEGFEEAAWPERAYLPGEVSDLGLREVWRAGRFRVSVTDPEGDTVRKARVELLSLPVEQGGAGAGRGPLQIHERDEGTWRYERWDVPRRAFELVVKRKGYRTHRAPVELEGWRTSIEVVLQPKQSDP